LKRKIVEYEQLQADIAELRQELGSTHVAQQMPRDIGQS